MCIVQVIMFSYPYALLLSEKSTDEADTEGGPSNKHAKTSHEDHMDKMAEVEKIEKKLQDKHEGVYTEEQLRCWAHLIEMKKHASYEVL